VKVGWLQDDHGYVGGAEMTAAEFRAAKPDEVEIIHCRPGEEWPECDVYVVNNAVQYTPEELEPLKGKVVKYAHDLFLHDFNGSRAWLREHARWIFCSPAQRERMELDGATIPPALKIRTDFTADRTGETVSIAQWRNPGKGASALSHMGISVDAYGPGPFQPFGPSVNYRGELPPERVPEVLATYKQFVFVPFEFEPFCRTVVEAYYAGCELTINGLIGARHYLEHDRDALFTAGEDFWAEVLK
jgi:hypothetical protein